MKVKIEYYYDKNASEHHPFWAKSLIGDGGPGKLIISCGENWEEVRKRQIEKLHEATANPEPPIAEEIDL
jgi:hypothetical protein